MRQWQSDVDRLHYTHQSLWSCILFIGVHHLRCNPKTSRTTCTKIKSKAGPHSPRRLSHPRLEGSPILHCENAVKVIIVAKPLCTASAQELCSYEYDEFTSRICVHSRILFRIEIVCCEAFSSAYPDKEIRNKTIHQLVTPFRNTRSICLRQELIERQNS